MKKAYLLVVLFLGGLSVGNEFAAAPAAGHLGQQLIEAAIEGNEPKVKELIALKADVNAKGGYGTTALMEAAIFDYPAIVKELVEAGADVNAQNNLRHTALQTAAEDGNMNMVMLLLRNGADKTIQNRVGKTAEDLARASNHDDIANMIRDYRPGGLTKAAGKTG